MCLAVWLAPTIRAADSDQMRGIELQRQSLEKQRAAVRQQAGIKDQPVSESFVLLPDLPPPAPQADCPSLDRDQLNELISQAAKKHSLPERVIRAVMHQESGFKPCAVSVKGAQGLMQLMPATAYELHVSDPFDPVQNVMAGTAFLKRLLDRYKGDLRLALVAYNAGAGRADQLSPDEYPAETQNYISSILGELGAGN